MKNIFSRRKSFKNDQRGAIAVIVAITLVLVLFGVLALSIDLNRSQTSHADMQGSTDAAAYGTAEWLLKEYIVQMNNNNWSAPSMSGVTSYAKRLLLSNFQKDNQNAVFDDSSLVVNHETFTSPNSPTGDAKQHVITVSACAFLSDKMADAAQMTNPDDTEDTKVCAISKAAFDLGKLVDAEIAFALDYTQSMYWNGDIQGCPTPPNSCPGYTSTKAYNLKSAMDNVLDNYFSSDRSSKAYASIVPFAGTVNLYPYSKTMIKQGNNLFRYKPNGDLIYSGSPIHNLQATDASNNYNLGFQNYQKHSGYIIWYTSDRNGGYEGQARSGYDPIGLNTKDYTYVLNRIPTFDEDLFDDIVESDPQDSGNSSGSNETFYNYYDLVDKLKNQTMVRNDWVQKYNQVNLSRADPAIWTPDPNETVRAKCYMGTIAAGLDQRIEKRERPDYDINGIVRSSSWYADNNGSTGSKRNKELHESFPVQPLTNNLDVLKKTVGRFTDSSFLYPENANISHDTIIDGQTSRLNKSRWFSSTGGTNSPQGLMWAWFTISKFWQGKWSAKSLTEDYLDRDLKLGIGSLSQQSRTNSDNPLPSKENTKHIILITDGYDNDGLEGVSQGLTTSPGIASGAYNSCDAFMPVEPFSDGSDSPSDRYQRLCKRIKDEGIKIHIILYGFQAVGVDDPSVKKYKACATENELYINPNPNQLPGSFNAIFSKILTEATKVRLIK